MEDIPFICKLIIKKSKEFPSLFKDNGGYNVHPTPDPDIFKKPIPNKKKIKEKFNNQ
jgi:hypothetical protein